MAQQKPQRPEGNYLRSIQGRVFLDRFIPSPPHANAGAIAHDFLLDNENTSDGRQLPQFLPRVDWPEPPYTLESRQLLGRYDTDIRDPNGIIDDRQAEIDRARAIDYRAEDPEPYLGPIGPFHTPGRQYRGKSWHEHVTHCHNILTDGIPNERYLSDVELQSLLTIASYGFDDSTYILDGEFVLPTPPRPPKSSKSPKWSERRLLKREVPEFGGKRLVSGDLLPHTPFETDDEARQLVRDRMAERRWVVVPVMAHGNHWCMTMFDRQNSALYIHDTMKEGRTRRVTGICHLWARFWNRIGLPYHFRYFAPETLEQPWGWECGHLGVAWVMHNLRNNVGEFEMPAIKKGARRGPGARRFNKSLQRDIHIGYWNGAFSYKPSKPLCNWTPAGYREGTSNFAAQGVMYVMNAALCNELGISDHPSMLALKSGRLDGTSAFDLITRIGKTLKDSKPDLIKEPRVPIAEFWTSTGGAQFSRRTAHEDVSTLKPEDEENRQHLPNWNREVAIIEYRGEYLVHRPEEQPGLWRHAREFTETNTLPVAVRTLRSSSRKRKRAAATDDDIEYDSDTETDSEDDGDGDGRQQPARKKQALAKKPQPKKSQTKGKGGGRKKGGHKR